MGQPCCASASVACYGTTYYIDCAAGNDANDGTEELSSGPGSGPWLHQPYMQGFTGNYTAATGDRFVFKGGVTCPNAYFPLISQQGGDEGAADYYGVDPSWFAGSSWSRPVFDMQGQLVGMDVDGNDADVELTQNWITLDNLEFKGHYWTGTWGWQQNASVATPQDPDGITVENCYFHGWTHDGYDGGATPDGYNVLFGDGQYNVATGCVMEDSDGDGASGTAALYWTTVVGSSIHDLTTGIYSAGTAEGNEIFNLHNSYDPNDNPVALLSYYAADNVVHDIGDNVGPLVIAYFAGPGTTPSYAWNNVAWDMNGIPMILAGQGCNECDAGSVYLWNNTLAATSSNPCIDLVNTDNGDVDVLDLRNNHCLTNGTAILTIDPNVSANFIPDAGNVLMTDNVAMFQGYAVSNAFAPTSAGDSTVDAGQNLSAQCSLALAPVCGDPEPACNPTLQTLCSDVDAVPRPAGGNWDVGAYEFR